MGLHHRGHRLLQCVWEGASLACCCFCGCCLLLLLLLWLRRLWLQRLWLLLLQRLQWLLRRHGGLPGCWLA